ncbi:MAG TPA: squalene/phytoene synthase family protein [Candidatus Acidoferrales bacterium]|nr:squalene/phytoene synthase family protein [Candidatus Acidoferrales bacterium]
MNPETYCRDVLDRRAPEWRVMLSFVPADQRALLEALYALRVEIEDLVVHAVEPGVAAAKLQWWRDALLAYPAATEHPILIALAQAQGARLDTSRLLAWCDGWGSELQYREIVDERDLDDLLMRRGGQFGALLASALDPAAALAGQRWGMLAAWPPLLLRLPRLATRGIVELPAAWLRHADLTATQFAATQPEEPVQRFYGKLIDQIRRRHDELHTTHPISAAVLPHRLELALSMRRLERWQGHGFETSAAQQPLPPLRRLAILWRAARQHRKDVRHDRRRVPHL